MQPTHLSPETPVHAEGQPDRERGRTACRFCDAPLSQTFVDLGMSPLCESFLSREQLDSMEPFYPLHARVCGQCFLVQVEELVSGEAIFGGEYAYFSSYSDSWLEHAAGYVEMIVDRFSLDEKSQVVELASNDGYLLKNFVSRRIPALGIEPADNVAAVAVANNVPTRVRFFGVATAEELVRDGIRADLLIANNVLAHVPNLNDFVAGMKRVLSPEGAITVEFPQLVRLIEENQFDTIYQEHYCYFSLYTVQKVFAAHGLQVFDVEELPTHGGSLRVYAHHEEDSAHNVHDSVAVQLDLERAAGIDSLETYRRFGRQVVETKWALVEFLIGLKRENKTIAAYGAPGKGNTLLNYCGIRNDFIDYVVDRNPYKHGKFLPGTRIPVFDTDRIAETKPDYVLILPWNLKDEIIEQLAYVREWGGKFVVPIPKVAIHS